MAQKYFVTASAEKIVAEAIKILYGQLQEAPVLNNAQKVVDYLRLRYGHLEYERFGALALNTRLQLLKDISLFRGTTNECRVYQKELFRELLLSGPVRGFIIYHNHPSGNPTPSREDIEKTWHLKRAGELLDFQLLDHVIVSAMGHYSFADDGHKALLE